MNLPTLFSFIYFWLFVTTFSSWVVYFLMKLVLIRLSTVLARFEFSRLSSWSVFSYVSHSSSNNSIMSLFLYMPSLRNTFLGSRGSGVLFLSNNLLYFNRRWTLCFSSGVKSSPWTRRSKLLLSTAACWVYILSAYFGDM